jgi:hypothetical protein
MRLTLAKLVGPYLKNKMQHKRAGACVDQVVESLHSMPKALGSIPSTTRNKQLFFLKTHKICQSLICKGFMLDLFFFFKLRMVVRTRVNIYQIRCYTLHASLMPQNNLFLLKIIFILCMKN